MNKIHTFNHLGKFICICGKEFNNSQSFNGHKGHCKEYLLSKGLNNDQINLRKKKQINWLHDANDKRNKLNKILKLDKKQQELEQWLAEKHICEKCGKVMTEKFGSGRFCSRICANTRKHSEITKIKIHNSLLQYNEENPRNKIVKEKIRKKHFSTKDSEIQYRVKLSNYDTLNCVICGNEFKRLHGNSRTTCSDECLHQLKIKRSTEAIKKNGYHKTIYSQYKFGTYKGFECDSSWELAFLVYCLDNDLSIERNKTGFNYIYKDTERTFFPDFLVKDTYYEIKGVWTDQVTAKVNQFPKDKKLTIIDRKCMKKYIDYCKNTYGKNFAEILYDVDKPNWTQSDKYKHFIEKDYHRKSISDVCY